jgi:hypothetical protein
LLVFSLLAYLEALSYPYRSSYFPRIIIILIGLMACTLLTKSIREWRKQKKAPLYQRPEKDEGLPIWKQEMARKVLLMTTGSIFYLAILNLLGFFATSIVYLPVMIWLLGFRKVKTIAISTFVVLVFIYLIFVTFLKVPLPEGMAF